MSEKISELDAAATLTGTELVPVVQGGATVRTTAALLAALASAAANYESVTGAGGEVRVFLGPRDVTPSTAIANAATVEVESITLLASRRHMLTVLLAATGEDDTEYAQLLHVTATTDGSTITASDFEVLRTMLDGAIAEAGDFPFTITLSSTGLAIEVNAENTSGQAVNMLAAAQLESYVQPAAPEGA